MAFSESTKDAAFKRSQGYCECARVSHAHWLGRCATAITRHSAEYHHVVSQDAYGSDGLENCEALCVPCHKATGSYGAH